MSIAPVSQYDFWKLASAQANLPDDQYDLGRIMAHIHQATGIHLVNEGGELSTHIDLEFEVSSDRPRLDACKFLLSLTAKIVTECGIEDAQELIEAVNALHAAALRKAVQRG